MKSHYKLPIWVIMALSVIQYIYMEIENGKTKYTSKKSLMRKRLNNSIRIHIEFIGSFNDFDYLELLKNKIFPAGKHSIESMIRIKYLSNSPVLLQRDCLGDSEVVNDRKICDKLGCKKFTKIFNISIPEKYLDKCYYRVNKHSQILSDNSSNIGEPDKDLILFIYLNDINLKGECNFPYFLYDILKFGYKFRPTYGALKICRKRVYNQVNPTILINAFKHEVIHILGFNEEAFAFFLNKKGERIFQRNITNSKGFLMYSSVIARIELFSRSSITIQYSVILLVFRMPNVLRKIRKHFNCPRLTGAHLDNDKRAARHLNKLMFGEEIMTLCHPNTLQVLSEITLAFLEDTGWYFVDYSKSQPLSWGKNSGCTFVETGCFKYLKNPKSIKPYCNSALILGKDVLFCNSHYFWFCDLKEYHNYDARYHYFDSLEDVEKSFVMFYRGSKMSLEYCPLPTMFTDFYEQTSDCLDSFNSLLPAHKSFPIESYFGSDSGCLEHDIEPKDPGKYYGASCFKMHPNNSTSFHFYYKDHKYVCFYESVLFIVEPTRNITFECGNFPPNLSHFVTKKRLHMIYGSKIPVRSKLIWILVLNLVSFAFI